MKLRSLLFVPAVFTLMDDMGLGTARLFGGFIGKSDEPPEHQPEARAMPVALAYFRSLSAGTKRSERNFILVASSSTRSCGSRPLPHRAD